MVTNWREYMNMQLGLRLMERVMAAWMRGNIRRYWFNMVLNWHASRGKSSSKDNILKVLGGMLMGWRMDATRIAYFRLCLNYLKSRNSEMVEQLDTLGEELSTAQSIADPDPSILSQVDSLTKEISDLQDELFKSKRSLEALRTENRESKKELESMKENQAGVTEEPQQANEEEENNDAANNDAAKKKEEDVMEEESPLTVDKILEGISKHVEKCFIFQKGGLPFNEIKEDILYDLLYSFNGDMMDATSKTQKNFVFQIQRKIDYVNRAIKDFFNKKKEEDDGGPLFEVPALHWEYEFPASSQKWYYLPTDISEDLEKALSESEERIRRTFKPHFAEQPCEMELLSLAHYMTDPIKRPYKLRRMQPLVSYLAVGIKPLVVTTSNLELTGKLPTHLAESAVHSLERGRCMGGSKPAY